MKTIVLIDSGNTRLKVGVIDATATSRASDGHAMAPDAGILTQALDNDDAQGLNHWLGALPRVPVAALGTNVAGPARAAVIETALAEIGCPLRWIVPRVQAYGLTSRYTQPELLGADRWVSMLGVMARREDTEFGQWASDSPGDALPGLQSDHAEVSTPFLLASFGTATTLDTVSGDGVFEGGLILPGPVMMRRSLASGTANLPLAEGDATAFPTDTQHAIASGVAAAQAGAVLRQWLAGMQRYGIAPQLYATGGGWHEVEAETRRLLSDAAAAMSRLPPAITVIENPVLCGLARIAAATNLEAS